MIRVKPLLAALLGLATLGSGAAYAQDVRPNWANPPQERGLQQDRRRQSSDQAIMSLREVVDMVRNRFGGELINARLEQGGGSPFYMLRWRMPNDSVEDLRVDAVSGRIMR